MKLKTLIGKSFFKVTGWKTDAGQDLLEDKQVIIGFPHTSNMDAVRSLAFFASIGVQVHTLIKKEYFDGPLAPVLKKLGAIPVDRSKGSNMAKNLAREFQARDQFTLVLAPEGTRGKDGVKPVIKTGFWQIAKAANVPIVLMLADNPRKHGRLIGKLWPSDLPSDLEQIAQIYAEYGVALKLPEAKKD